MGHYYVWATTLYGILLCIDYYYVRGTTMYGTLLCVGLLLNTYVIGYTMYGRAIEYI